ncbi:MAG: hypothetical protein ABIA12_00800 [Candidatus Aenigmatarchaeota archaeon]
MAKRADAAMRKGALGEINSKFSSMLPLFIITVCIVFSFVFTVLTVPLGPTTWDIKFVFIMLLVVTTTVASTVSVMFYVFILNKQNGNGKRRRR